MNEKTPLDDVKDEAGLRGKDPRSRRILIVLLILWLATLVVLLIVTWNAYFDQKDKAQTLAQQIDAACAQGDLGRGLEPDDLTQGLSREDEEALCSNAKEVIEEDDPELQEGEIQEAEIQDPESQDPEVQDSENQEAERQDPEIQDPEIGDDEIQDLEEQEGENQEPEIQDDETQDPEIDDPENQDPEIDDPDPNDQIKEGSCTFDGVGTIVFTFETSSGPVTFQCTGTQVPPGQN